MKVRAKYKKDKQKPTYNKKIGLLYQQRKTKTEELPLEELLKARPDLYYM